MNHQDLPKEIAEEIAKKLDRYEPGMEAKRVGVISRVADGVVMIHGLPQVRALELIAFPHGVMGVAVNLEEDVVGAIVLGDYLGLSEGDEVLSTGTLLSVPVGDAFLGRVVNPMGTPLDGKGPISTKKSYPMERVAPGVTKRQPVTTPPNRYQGN